VEHYRPKEKTADGTVETLTVLQHHRLNLLIAQGRGEAAIDRRESDFGTIEPAIMHQDGVEGMTVKQTIFEAERSYRAGLYHEALALMQKLVKHIGEENARSVPGIQTFIDRILATREMRKYRPQSEVTENDIAEEVSRFLTVLGLGESDFAVISKAEWTEMLARLANVNELTPDEAQETIRGMTDAAIFLKEEFIRENISDEDIPPSFAMLIYPLTTLENAGKIHEAHPNLFARIGLIHYLWRHKTYSEKYGGRKIEGPVSAAHLRTLIMPLMKAPSPEVRRTLNEIWPFWQKGEGELSLRDHQILLKDLESQIGGISLKPYHGSLPTRETIVPMAERLVGRKLGYFGKLHEVAAIDDFYLYMVSHRITTDQMLLLEPFMAEIMHKRWDRLFGQVTYELARTNPEFKYMIGYIDWIESGIPEAIEENNPVRESVLKDIQKVQKLVLVEKSLRHSVFYILTRMVEQDSGLMIDEFMNQVSEEEFQKFGKRLIVYLDALERISRALEITEKETYEERKKLLDTALYILFEYRNAVVARADDGTVFVQLAERKMIGGEELLPGMTVILKISTFGRIETIGYKTDVRIENGKITDEGKWKKRSEERELIPGTFDKGASAVEPAVDAASTETPSADQIAQMPEKEEAAVIETEAPRQEEAVEKTVPEEQKPLIVVAHESGEDTIAGNEGYYPGRSDEAVNEYMKMMMTLEGGPKIPGEAPVFTFEGTATVGGSYSTEEVGLSIFSSSPMEVENNGSRYAIPAGVIIIIEMTDSGITVRTEDGELKEAPPAAASEEAVQEKPAEEATPAGEGAEADLFFPGSDAATMLTQAARDAARTAPKNTLQTAIPAASAAAAVVLSTSVFTALPSEKEEAEETEAPEAYIALETKQLEQLSKVRSHIEQRQLEQAERIILIMIGNLPRGKRMMRSDLERLLDGVRELKQGFSSGEVFHADIVVVAEFVDGLLGQIDRLTRELTITIDRKRIRAETEARIARVDERLREAKEAREEATRTPLTFSTSDYVQYSRLAGGSVRYRYDGIWQTSHFVPGVRDAYSHGVYNPLPEFRVPMSAPTRQSSTLAVAGRDVFPIPYNGMHPEKYGMEWLYEVYGKPYVTFHPRFRGVRWGRQLPGC